MRSSTVGRRRDLVSSRGWPGSSPFGLADVLMEDYRLHDLCADREDRVERRHRLLKDHADVAAADRLHLALRELHQVLAEKSDAARFNVGVRRKQPHDRERRNALT